MAEQTASNDIFDKIMTNIFETVHPAVQIAVNANF